MTFLLVWLQVPPLASRLTLNVSFTFTSPEYIKASVIKLVPSIIYMVYDELCDNEAAVGGRRVTTVLLQVHGRRHSLRLASLRVATAE